MRTFLAVLACVVAPLLAATSARAETAIFAGGCFWCVESDFDKVPGVTATVSGFTGGSLANPTYDDVKAGGTGHYEAVKITYDPARVSYEELVYLFLRSVDPTDAGGQFCDRGDSYRTAIFASGKQKAVAEKVKAEASDVVLTRAGPKSKKNAYKFYRKACGRDARVRELWGQDAAFLK
jgi:peptide-methionine (S)-S-oxide reductase